MSTGTLAACCVISTLVASTMAYGQEAHAPPETGANAPKQARSAPYSLPWQLRPVVVGNVVRSDTTIAFYQPEGADNGGRTIASMLLASVKVAEEIAPLVRVGVVHNDPPDLGPTTPEAASGFLNPVVGATYAPQLATPFKLGVFLGVALPLGAGGGDDPDPGVAAALAAGVLARSGMDNAMFAVNYLTVFPGVGFAYVDGGVTLQAEVTLLRLMRARGGDTIEADSAKTNLTSGLHAGYFVLPWLSLGAELRYQRWLSTPKKPPVEARDSLRDVMTVAVGPRFHAKLGEKTWIRPGIAYCRALDAPMTKSDYQIVQIDLPVSF